MRIAPELRGRGWLNTGEPLDLAGLRGKIVILDFWTFCCINCLHVLDELRELEDANRGTVVIIGVHSPKFAHEADPDALTDAVERYEVRHPVLDDPQLLTWQAYGARAWPTLVVIDPEGNIAGQFAGEGHAASIEALVADLIVEHSDKGTLRVGGDPYVPPPARDGALVFPAKVIELPDGHLLVANPGRHNLVELDADGEELRTIDGFAEPNGLCLLPRDIAQIVGYDVVVADSVGHALLGVDVASGTVRTVAGRGRQWMGNDELPSFEDGFTSPLDVSLSSPWDVAWSPVDSAIVVAMAGIHQLWLFDPVTGRIGVFAGTTNEGLLDGPVAQTWLAQPSGVAVAPDGMIWFVDSETSALRMVTFYEPRRVLTVVGTGLFTFGHRDGLPDDALMQHPLGVAVDGTGQSTRVYVADTYNGALRCYDYRGFVSTIATDLDEPSGVLVRDDDLLAVESAAHRLVGMPKSAIIDDTVTANFAATTTRPVTTLRPGAVRIEVSFTPPAGQKLDESFGPATQLSVSATPPELIESGAGDGVELCRVVTIAEGVTEGVVHVTARAASCDADPEIEFPACHLAQQDWGIPIVVRADGAETLELPLGSRTDVSTQ